MVYYAILQGLLLLENMLLQNLDNKKRHSLVNLIFTIVHNKNKILEASDLNCVRRLITKY